jgi:hypothetical protein
MSYRILTLDGTATAPGWRFANDTDTGFYRIGVDNLGLSLGGTKRWDFAAAGSTLTGTLTVSGAVTLQSTLAVTGNATLSGTLGVTGAATLSSTLAVTGDATFNGTGTQTFAGRLRVGGYSGTAPVNGIGVAGAIDAQSTLAVTGNTTLSGALGIRDGTVSSLGLWFSADTDTGFYRHAVDRMGIATGGVARVLIDAADLANETTLAIWVNAGVASTRRVSVGAADSGGTGFRMLVVPN